MHCAKWKKPDLKGYILYLYEILEKTKQKDGKQFSGFQGLGEGVEADYQEVSQGILFRVV